MADSLVTPGLAAPAIDFKALELVAVRTQTDAILILQNRTSVLRVRLTLEEADYLVAKLRRPNTFMTIGGTNP